MVQTSGGIYQAITYLSNRFAAGLVRACKLSAEANKSRDVAGLWVLNSQIPIMSLIWVSSNGNTRANNGSPSWASSILGAVTHPYLFTARLDQPGYQIEVMSTRVVPATSNTFGQVRDAELTLQGLVHDYTGAKHYDFSTERVSHRRLVCYNTEIISLKQPRNEKHLISQHGAEKIEFTEYPDTKEPIYQYQREKRIILFVAEFAQNAVPGWPPSHQRHFIILRPLSSKDPQCYQRAGTARLEARAYSGFSDMRSTYTKANGWTRENLVLY